MKDRVKGLSTCRCQDFDRTSTGLEERNVESATAEVEDTHELLLIAARTVRESHRHGLLEQTHFCETWLWNRAKREREDRSKERERRRSEQRERERGSGGCSIRRIGSGSDET